MNGIKQTQSHPVKIIFDGHCPSISEKTELFYQIGTYSAGEKICLRVSESLGGAKTTPTWTWEDAIALFLTNNYKLTGTNFFKFQTEKSNNTGAFILAVLLDIGLASRNEQEYIFSNHVPQTDYMQLVMKHIKERALPIPKL